jgi:hypothetical protein
MKETITGKLLDSLPRNDAVAELCCVKFNVANCPDQEGKLPIPAPLKNLRDRPTYFST